MWFRKWSLGGSNPEIASGILAGDVRECPPILDLQAERYLLSLAFESAKDAINRQFPTTILVGMAVVGNPRSPHERRRRDERLGVRAAVTLI